MSDWKRFAVGTAGGFAEGVSKMAPAKQAVIQRQQHSAMTGMIGYKQMLAASGLSPYAGTTPTQKPGDVVQGMEFQGGDPRNKNDWMPQQVVPATPYANPNAPANGGGLLSTVTDAQAKYLKALDELNAMKISWFQTPQNNKAAIAAKEAEVNALLQATH